MKNAMYAVRTSRVRMKDDVYVRITCPADCSTRIGVSLSLHGFIHCWYKGMIDITSITLEEFRAQCALGLIKLPIFFDSSTHIEFPQGYEAFYNFVEDNWKMWECAE